MLTAEITKELLQELSDERERKRKKFYYRFILIPVANLQVRYDKKFIGRLIIRLINYILCSHLPHFIKTFCSDLLEECGIRSFTKTLTPKVLQEIKNQSIKQILKDFNYNL